MPFAGRPSEFVATWRHLLHLGDLRQHLDNVVERHQAIRVGPPQIPTNSAAESVLTDCILATQDHGGGPGFGGANGSTKAQSRAHNPS